MPVFDQNKYFSNSLLGAIYTFFSEQNKYKIKSVFHKINQKILLVSNRQKMIKCFHRVQMAIRCEQDKLQSNDLVVR